MNLCSCRCGRESLKPGPGHRRCLHLFAGGLVAASLGSLWECLISGSWPHRHDHVSPNSSQNVSQIQMNSFDRPSNMHFQRAPPQSGTHECYQVSLVVARVLASMDVLFCQHRFSNRMPISLRSDHWISKARPWPSTLSASVCGRACGGLPWFAVGVPN